MWGDPPSIVPLHRWCYRFPFVACPWHGDAAALGMPDKQSFYLEKCDTSTNAIMGSYPHPPNIQVFSMLHFFRFTRNLLPFHHFSREVNFHLHHPVQSSHQGRVLVLVMKLASTWKDMQSFRKSNTELTSNIL